MMICHEPIPTSSVPTCEHATSHQLLPLAITGEPKGIANTLLCINNSEKSSPLKSRVEFICVLWLTRRFRCFIAEPDFVNTGNFSMSIIHLDSKVSGTHLMGIVGTSRISYHLTFERSINPFQAFYVNRYRDHPRRTRLGLSSEGSCLPIRHVSYSCINKYTQCYIRWIKKKKGSFLFWYMNTRS